MKANKRIRDLKRRSELRLVSTHENVVIGTTTCPINRSEMGKFINRQVRVTKRPGGASF